MNHTKQKVNKAIDSSPIYFNNIGLFSDHFITNRLSSIDEWSNNDFLVNFWNPNKQHSVEIENIFNSMKQLWDSEIKKAKPYKKIKRLDL